MNGNNLYSLNKKRMGLGLGLNLEDQASSPDKVESIVDEAINTKAQQMGGQPQMQPPNVDLLQKYQGMFQEQETPGQQQQRFGAPELYDAEAGQELGYAPGDEEYSAYIRSRKNKIDELRQNALNAGPDAMQVIGAAFAGIGKALAGERGGPELTYNILQKANSLAEEQRKIAALSEKEFGKELSQIHMLKQKQRFEEKMLPQKLNLSLRNMIVNAQQKNQLDQYLKNIENEAKLKGIGMKSESSEDIQQMKNESAEKVKQMGNDVLRILQEMKGDQDKLREEIRASSRKDVAGIGAESRVGVAEIGKEGKLGAADIGKEGKLGAADIYGKTRLGAADISAKARIEAAKIAAGARVSSAKNKLPDQERSTVVPDLNVLEGATPTKNDVKEAKKIKSGFDDFTNVLNELKTDVNKYGFKVLPSPEKDRMKNAYASLMLKVKNLEQMGALQAHEGVLIREYVRDPTTIMTSGLESFGSITPKDYVANIENAARLAKDATSSRIRAFGYEMPQKYKPMKGFTGETKLQKEIGVSSQDKEALKFLKDNPGHPRANMLRAKLKSKGLIK